VVQDTVTSLNIPIWLQEAATVAFDIETTGLNVRKDKVIGFGVSDGINSAYFVHLFYENGTLQEKLSKEECIRVLELLKNKNLICWNSSFDIRFTKNYFGTDLTESLYSDGMLAFHTVQEEGVPFSHKPFALKSVAAYFLGAEVTTEQDDMKASIKANGGSATEFYKADTELMAKYCMQDCRLTITLANQFHEQLEKEGLDHFYFEKEVIPLLKYVTIPMEDRGIPVDVTALQTSLEEINKDLAVLENKIQAAITPHLAAFNQYFFNKEYPPKRTGPFAQSVAHILAPGTLPTTASGAYSFAAKHVDALPDGLLKSWLQEKCYLPEDVVRAAQEMCHGQSHTFNLLSKFHLKRLFFDELKCTPLSYTDTGLPQCDEAFLESVKDKFAWVPALLEFNKLTKIKGTYIERFLEKQEDGMFYPSFFQHRTTSGRFGSDLQQLPRPLSEEEESSALIRHHNNKIRAFFISGPGYKFLDADYNSLEVVVFADDAGDESLLTMIKENKDFYSQVAIDALGLPQYSADKKASNFLKKMKPELRQAAKVYGLGIRYGMEAFKLSKTLNISQEEAEAIIHKYFKAYPRLAAKMNFYEQHAKEHGYIQSKAGRRRHLPRLKKLYEEYGDTLSNALEVWKQFHEQPALYDRMKRVRRDMNNLINNALNFPIQSLAASIVNQSMIELAKWIKDNNVDAYICLNVHDQGVVRCADKDIEKTRPMMKYIMETTIKLDAPLVADPQIAINLRDGH
jgi:DNA polymerase I-like protein with 3'-5' exonuclease and polymerase domains